MLAFTFLFVVIVLLVILAGYAYRSEDGAPQTDDQPDRRLDRLATMLDVDVMEGVIATAREEGVPEVTVLNRLLRSGLEASRSGNPPRS